MYTYFFLPFLCCNIKYLHIVLNATQQDLIVNPFQEPFISFSFLIAVARTSSTMLNNRGESGHPCLVSEYFIFFLFFKVLLKYS